LIVKKSDWTAEFERRTGKKFQYALRSLAFPLDQIQFYWLSGGGVTRLRQTVETYSRAHLEAAIKAAGEARPKRVVTRYDVSGGAVLAESVERIKVFADSEVRFPAIDDAHAEFVKQRNYAKLVPRSKRQGRCEKK